MAPRVIVFGLALRLRPSLQARKPHLEEGAKAEVAEGEGEGEDMPMTPAVATNPMLETLLSLTPARAK